MTRNENKLMRLCIESILEQTCSPFHIYIVDNNSSDEEQLNILNGYVNHPKITIIRNKTNLWVLGVNETLQRVKASHQSKYFVLTDGDIEFKNKNSTTCWLSELVKYMSEYSCIGKIGLSLDWNLISSDPFYSEIYQQEQKLYDESRKIGPLYISPVDTTAAIYRWDWSISGFEFYPDHIRYLRPEMYSCRTPRDFTVEHHGWLSYKDIFEPKKLDEKIKCFTLMGADIKKTQIKMVNYRIRLFYLLLAKPMKVFWGMRRRFFLLSYFLSKGLRKFDNH